MAGGPLENDIIASQLRPVDPRDYEVDFTSEECARLLDIFPYGVCDWSEPGVEQRPLLDTWLSFGPSPVNRVRVQSYN